MGNAGTEPGPLAGAVCRMGTAPAFQTEAMMCLGCWEEEGKPFAVTDAVRAWAPKFREADPFGALHIVVEDWNLDDENIAYCRRRADADETALLDALQSMSEGERWATAILAEQPDFRPEAA